MGPGMSGEWIGDERGMARQGRNERRRWLMVDLCALAEQI